MPEAALRGILPVLQIPFTAGNRVSTVDEDALRREVEFCIARGVHGLVVPALASEFMVLTDRERRLVVEATLSENAGRLPVVVNVSAPSTNAAIECSQHAREHGAAAVMALPPYVRRPTMNDVFAYYAAIADEARLPVIVQNAPPPFGVSLPTTVVLRLVAEIEGVRYIKEERPPAPHHISDVLAQADDRLHGVFGGMAGLFFPNELHRGVIGTMPSAGLCDVLAAIYDAWQAGDIVRARAIHGAVVPLLSLEMSVWMAVSKDVLRRRGIFPNSLMRDPEFSPLDAGDMAEIDALWPQVSAHFTVR